MVFPAPIAETCVAQRERCVPIVVQSPELSMGRFQMALCRDVTLRYRLPKPGAASPSPNQQTLLPFYLFQYTGDDFCQLAPQELTAATSRDTGECLVIHRALTEQAKHNQREY